MSNETEFIQSPRPTDNFLILDKRISEDDRLSLEARAILIYLLGKPPRWRVIIENLVNLTARSDRKAGKHVIYASLKELIEFGYVSRRKMTTGEVAYFVHGEPIKPRDYMPVRAGTPDSENQEQEASHGSAPDSKNPNLGKPNLGNPTLVSTEEAVSTEKAPRTKKAAASQPLPEWLDPQLWQEWKDHRKEIRKPMTKRAETIAIKQLGEFRAAGGDLRTIIERSIGGGWTTFYLRTTDTVVVSAKDAKSLDAMDYSQSLF